MEREIQNGLVSSEKRGGARPFFGNYGWKRGGGRYFSPYKNFYSPRMDDFGSSFYNKRGGGHFFNELYPVSVATVGANLADNYDKRVSNPYKNDMEVGFVYSKENKAFYLFNFLPFQALFYIF